MARYYADAGQRRRVLVNGDALEARLAERLTKATLSLSNSATSQLVLGVADPKLQLLRSDELDKGTEIRFADLRLVVAVRELVLDGSTPALQVTARARGIQKMRRTRGGRVWRGLSPTQWVHMVGRAADLRVVAEPSHQRKVIHRAAAKKGEPGESDLDVFNRLASELGFIGYESQQTLYFGRPTWLAKRLPQLDVVWRVDGDPEPDGLLAVPAVRDSDDDTAHGFTRTLSVSPVAAERFTPNRAVHLTGMGPYSGVYLITDTSLTLDGSSPASVTIATPVNPDPEPPERTTRSADSSGGGSRRLRELLADAGFKGDNLNEAVGIVVAESGADAHAIGDVTLADAKWGPSVGLFQIRSLRHPAAFSGVDALRVKGKLRDPVYNARVAYRLSRGGADWSPWSTWNSGAWRAHQRANPIVKHWRGVPASSSVVVATGAATGLSGGTRAVWPTTSRRISTPWRQPGSWAAGHHTGVDIDGNCGDPIWSATEGVVVRAGYDGDYGYTVTVRYRDHDLMYCHLGGPPRVRVGQRVSPGTRLGTMGETGRAFGCHLHFEVRPAGGRYGSDVNPLRWLP